MSCVLGIDVGSVYLGICVLHNGVIQYLDSLTLTSKKRPSVEELGYSLYKYLDDVMSRYELDRVSIENQPYTLKNPTVKTVQTLIHSYFILYKHRNQCTIPEIDRITPASKMKGMKGGAYKDNKRNSIELVYSMIEGEDIKIAEYPYERFKNAAKRDDMSDAVLIALCGKSKCS